jgi:hypothetical protein
LVNFSTKPEDAITTLILILILIITELLRQFYNRISAKKKERSSLEFALNITLAVHQLLTTLLAKTGSNRAYLYNFHNGQISLSNLHLMKMSCDNEVVDDGVSKECTNSQDILISEHSAFLNNLINSEVLIYDDINEIREHHTKAFFSARGVCSLACHIIRNKDNKATGFVCIDFTKKQENISGNITIQAHLKKYTEDIAFKLNQ